MGLGQRLGVRGSSASSSTLSPLAPPFTVDQPNPRPNSNPHTHTPFTEPLYTAVPRQSSYNNWQYSHSSASRPEVYSNLDSDYTSIRTGVFPSASDYGCLGSHSVSSTNAHMPNLNPSDTSANDAFSFLQYPSGIPSICVETKSYYPPSVSPVVGDAIPLVALNEPSYDLLPTSSFAPLGGDTQVDYGRCLSGLEYMSPSVSIRNNRLPEEEHGKRDASFCLEKANDAGSYGWKEYIKQANVMNKASAAPVIRPPYMGTSSKMPNTATSADVANNSKVGWHNPSNQKETLLPSRDGKFGCLDSGRPILQVERSKHVFNASFSTGKEELSSTTIAGKKLQLPHINVMKKSSPAIVIRPPSLGTSSKMPNTATADSKEGRHNPSNQKEPLLPLGDGNLGCLDAVTPILQVERSDHVFNASSSTGKEEPSSTTIAGKKLQLPDINVPYGITPELDSAKGFCPVKYSSEDLEHYNPAVDSPCWKGTPASPFSPFEASETVAPEAHICPPCADDNVEVSFPNRFENSEYQKDGYVELGSLLSLERLLNVNCPTGEQSSVDVVKAGFICPRPRSRNEVQFSNVINSKIKESDVLNDPQSDGVLKLSHAIQPGFNKGDFISERGLKIRAEVVDPGLNTNVATEDSIVSFHGLESNSFSPCSAENFNKLDKMHAAESRPKMNVKMLVEAIHNLSELLLFESSNDAYALSEQNHEALKCVINNLDTCVSKRIVNMTPARESKFAEQCTSPQVGNFPECNKGVGAGRTPMAKEAGTSSKGLFDRDGIRGREVEKFPEFVSVRGNADNVNDDNMVQAIKGVLKEDFSCEEEMQLGTLFFKNLWLEAEAALCCMRYKARFNRMKFEMEKCKSHMAEECSLAIDKLLNSKASPDPNTTQKVTHESKDSPLPDNNIKDSPISSTTKVVDVVEASPLARFDILNCRGENSKSVSTKGRYNGPVLGDPTEGGSSVVTVGHSQYCSISHNKRNEFDPYIGRFGYETMADMGVCATDDKVTQSYRNSKLGSPLPPRWCDGFSSDWEHVLNDEFASQK